MTTHDLVNKIKQPKPFLPVDQWHEDIGDALFFDIRLGEAPFVTSPISSDWDDSYTHFMLLPKEFRLLDDYRKACIQSGIESKV